MLLRGRRAVRHSTFSLGRFGPFINAATIVWIALAVVLFCMPTAIPVAAPTMNYASVVFSFFALISIVWYIVSGRKNFSGPPVPADIEPEVDGQVVKDTGGMERPESGSEKTLGESMRGKRDDIK